LKILLAERGFDGLGFLAGGGGGGGGGIDGAVMGKITIFDSNTLYRV
jgi:hypothetical protein